jgi:hypothetical protein
MSHQFKLGQRVRESGSSEAANRNARGDTYEVVRLMPEDRGGALGYRIKSATGERAVTEDQIIPA